METYSFLRYLRYNKTELAEYCADVHAIYSDVCYCFVF